MGSLRWALSRSLRRYRSPQTPKTGPELRIYWHLPTMPNMPTIGLGTAGKPQVRGF
mgnify:CR=1 FL=1